MSDKQASPSGGPEDEEPGGGVHVIVFEVGVPENHFISDLATVHAVSQGVHVPEEDLLHQPWLVTGPPDEIEAFPAFLQQRGRPPHAGNRMLHQAPRRLRFIATWRRPSLDEDEATVEALLATLAWANVPLRVRIDRGRLVVHAMDPDDAKLSNLYEQIEGDFGGTFRVKLLRSGPAGTPLPDLDASLSSEDVRLMKTALEMGYYEQPKRCGTRELAEALGMARSTVSRKLRAIERSGLEELRAQYAPTEEAEEVEDGEEGGNQRDR